MSAHESAVPWVCLETVTQRRFDEHLGDAEVPEADALDQARPVDPDEDAAPPVPHPSSAPDVPEADGLEQAQDVQLDDQEDDPWQDDVPHRASET